MKYDKNEFRTHSSTTTLASIPRKKIIQVVHTCFENSSTNWHLLPRLMCVHAFMHRGRSHLRSVVSGPRHVVPLTRTKTIVPHGFVYAIKRDLIDGVEVSASG